jgi:dTDP-4-amino-4,6-dideoxygalactose transaminase
MDCISSKNISVFVPLLPKADRLLPYLKEIDAGRRYSNGGPLLERFEAALAEHFDVAADRVVAVANATAGLTLSLLAAGPAAGGLCIMPSWTHEATAVAALRAGLTPWFHDVDEETWRLDPDTVAASIRREPRVAHVLVTAPFGAAVDQAPWAALMRDTGVAVTVDAAAGFDSLRGGDVDAVVSLHATKVFGIGEGGVVVAADASAARRIRHSAQLGLSDERRMLHVGMNAKLSEYGAAVGLAGMSEWPSRRRRLSVLRDDFAAALNGNDGVRLWSPVGVSSTLMARLSRETVDGAQARLQGLGIETRRWWGRGCHRQPALAGCPRTATPVTETLADSVIGLPFHADISPGDIARIVAGLADGATGDVQQRGR